MSAEKQKMILLVEDEMITAMAEKTAIEKVGYKVIIANSGKEAVAAIEKTPAIDLILMDINLGDGIDGTEAAAIILRQRDLPVVFLSSHAEPEVVAKTEKITSYGYVVKNSGITVLDASIKMAFKLFESKLKEKEKESRMEVALEALRESEQRLNFHVNNSPLAIIEWTTDFIVTRWSGGAEKIFGWQQSETIGKPIMDLQMIYDEDIPIVQKTMERLSDGSSKNVISTNRNYTKEGKVIICEWYNSVLLNPQGKMISVMSQVIDISERKQAEEARWESEKWYRALVENASDLVYRADKEGHFTFINRAALTITGYEERELIGKHYPTLIRPDMRRKAVALFGRQIAKGTNNTYSEFPVLTKDGREVWFGQNSQLIMADGQVTGFQAVSRDITERKQAEEVIKRQLSEKEILLKEVHHRIKNNIASIGGLISLHMQSVTNPEAVAVLQEAIGRVNSMRILYDKLLLSEDYKDISVKNYLESLSATVVAIFPDNAKIKLDQRIDDFQLAAKRLFLLGIISNELITNKIKYAFINKDAGIIKISLKNVKNHVTLTIQDNGNELPGGFDIEQTKGFGLMLVKMLSQQLGGSFAIEKHKGTRCTVEFDI
jgi:PAS domain S-box-containing protein